MDFVELVVNGSPLCCVLAVHLKIRSCVGLKPWYSG
jgi:hypothetical protein